MKLLGEKIKEFFSGKRGVFIDTNDRLIFVDCIHGKTNVIRKPENEEYPEFVMNVLYSDMFDVVKILNDEEQYEIKLVFDFVIFEHVDKNGEIDFELGISGKRYWGIGNTAFWNTP